MEEDILNFSPTVMFCGTPCSRYTNILAQVSTENIRYENKLIANQFRENLKTEFLLSENVILIVQ